MVQVGVMLVTCQNMDEPLADILEQVADAGFEGVEFADWVWPLVNDHRDELEAIQAVLERTSLDATTAMPPIEWLEDDLEEFAIVYGSLGVETFAIGINDVSYFESEDRVLEAARRINTLADRVEDRGFDLVYHNHTHEFVSLGEEIAYDRFVAELDDNVGLEIDTAWVAVAGFDPVETIERYGHRTPIIHHKGADLTAETDCEVGEGDLDQQAIADAAVAAGVDWLNYEYSSPPDPVASLRHGAECVKRYREVATR